MKALQELIPCCNKVLTSSLNCFVHHRKFVVDFISLLSTNFSQTKLQCWMKQLSTLNHCNCKYRYTILVWTILLVSACFNWDELFTYCRVSVHFFFSFWWFTSCRTKIVHCWGENSRQSCLVLKRFSFCQNQSVFKF